MPEFCLKSPLPDWEHGARNGGILSPSWCKNKGSRTQMTGTWGWKSRQKLPSVPPLGEPQDISKLTPLSFDAGIVRSTGRRLCYSETLRFLRYRVVHSLLQQHMCGFPLRAAAGNQGHPIFVKRSYLGRRWLRSLCQGQDWMGLAA